MRVRWRERAGLRDLGRRRFVCEVRRSEKRDGVQRKLTLAHLGTVHTGSDGIPSRDEAARFWRTAARKLRAMRLGRATLQRLMKSMNRRFPRPRARG
jgi:hypothetical protein